MAAAEHVLAVGVYASAEDALRDLRDVTGSGPLAGAIAGAGILRRGTTHSALQQGGGGTLAYGIGTGAAAGIVAGVVLSLPLVGAAAGAVIGGLVGRRLARREVDGFVAQLGEAVPVGATALLAVVDARRLPEVRAALGRALRTTGRVLDEGPLTPLARSLVRGSPEVTEALDRQGGHES